MKNRKLINFNKNANFNHPDSLTGVQDYSTKDGSGVRDYIHVVDLAKGQRNTLEIMSEI